MYVVLDIFFMIFHSLLVVFNLTGWIWKITRPSHLITISMTLFSWVGLGFFYGFGYCFLTDWHYQVLNKLGQSDLPRSYITYLLHRLTGWSPSDEVVRLVAVSLFILVSLISYGLYLDKILSKASRKEG